MLYSNPITGMVVADLNLTENQQARLRQLLDGMLRERAGRDRQATLTNGVATSVSARSESRAAARRREAREM